MAFPSTFSSFNRPLATDRLNSPSHSALHNSVSSALGQLEAVIGLTGASSVLGTIEGDLRSPSSGGGGHVQTAALGGTGQTTFTKGDVLVAQSASVLTKLAVGADNQVLVANSGAANGLAWGAAPTIVVSSTIALSSVWTRPAAITSTSKVFVQLWGGGGSGGLGANITEAGGGGGGGYAEGWYTASTLSASVLLNVGKGGDSSGTNTGNNGAITVFGVNTSMLTAYFGGGGGSNNTGAGGGGGGGTFFGGQTGGATAGGGGSVFGGDGGPTTLPGLYGGGGGNGQAGGTANNGGAAFFGGGGGGGVTSVAGSTGGASSRGGAGSGGSILGAAVASTLAGSIPGGGGGAAYGSAGSSGAGGNGLAIITTFL